MTKEDYMRLPKERLAELLAEKDKLVMAPITIPSSPISPYSFDYCPLSGGACSNPFHDCFNCPRHAIGITYKTTCNATINKEEEKKRDSEL